jgi:2-(1,2-epoxy-1,2-dihydrophenyl)acetyl-CoA isomerase
VTADRLVLVERDGPRVDLVLNRPERKNAIVQGLAVELRDAIHAVGSDPSVGAIVLRGAGGAFCSGIDLKAGGADGAPPEPLTAWVEVHQALHRCPAPVVVALERYAINAGAALALAADLCVAGESAFLQVGEIAMGVAAPMCQAWLHLRHSRSVADRVTLLGDRIAAPDLLRLGLVTEVVTDDEVVARARALADRIAGFPPSGRDGVAAVWQRLRGGPDDADAWFASLMALGPGLGTLMDRRP